MKILALCSTDLRYTLPLGFKEAGHEVIETGPIVEDKLRKQIEQFKPDFLFSMGWTSDQFHGPLLITKRVSKELGIPHVYWSIEDPAFTDNFCIPCIKKSQPDFVFTICPETLERYKKMGIKCGYLDFGYSSSIHHPITEKEDPKYSITVVANLYPTGLYTNKNFKRLESIRKLIIPLLKENIRVDFWGRDWEKSKAYLGHEIPKEWLHGCVPYKDTNNIYNSSIINIGIQNTDHLLTIRSYEILAAGGFLLTQATTRVKNSFKVGEQLVASSSPEETINLVKYYLNHPEERKKIAMQATAAVTGQSYKDRAQYAIEVLRGEGILKK